METKKDEISLLIKASIETSISLCLTNLCSNDIFITTKNSEDFKSMNLKGLEVNLQHVDLDTLERFTFRVRDSNIPALNFSMSINHNRTGILKDERKYMAPHYATTAINQYNDLLDAGYSIALNEKCYRLDEVRNYTHPKLIQIEIDILLKSAKIFCKVEKLYKTAELNQHISKSAQLLVDRLYKRILHFSSEV